MRSYYKVDFFKVTYNKETDERTSTYLGSTEVNDDCVTSDLPLCRKAALRAPAECMGWNEMKYRVIRTGEV